MRVTDRLMFERSAREGARAREALDAARQLVSTGRRVNHPSDDPGTAGAIAAFAVSSARNLALSRSADLASKELGAADGALDRVGNIVSRARELAVRFSSDGYTASERGLGATEVKGLVTDAIAALNTRYANRWVFGGTRDDAPPFDTAGAYLGDANPRQIEVAPGVLQTVSVRADEAIKGTAGGVDVLATLQSLQAALEADDKVGVQNLLEDLDDGITQVATARSEVGISMNALDAAAQAGKLAAEDEQVALVALSETDIVDASIQLAQAERALEASLSATAKSIQLSLLDYLR